MPNKREVVIIGAGVIGCSIAYHLAKRGVPSQIIEMDSIAARASGKAWAVFVYPPIFLLYEGPPTNDLFWMPMSSVRPWLELCWLGYHRLPDVALELKEVGGMDVGYGELSWNRLAFTEAEVKAQKTNLSIFNNAGYYEPHWLDAKEVKAMVPEITPKVRGALSSPCLQVEPYKFTLGLFQVAEKRGASITQGRAVGFRKKGRKVTSVVLADGSEINGDIFVLAMGPWSKLGTAWLEKEIPVRINREQCLRVQVPKRLPPCALRGPKVGIVPKPNGEVILGISGQMDLQTEYEVNQTTPEMGNEILEAAIEVLPMLSEAKLVEHRGDLECWSPPPHNVEPLVGLLPEWENAYLATGFGTEGIEMSLGTGQVMSELIIGRHIPNRFRTMLESLGPARLNRKEN